MHSAMLSIRNFAHSSPCCFESRLTATAEHRQLLKIMQMSQMGTEPTFSGVSFPCNPAGLLL